MLGSIIPGLVGLLIPAAEHVLGADATVEAKHAWVSGAVKEILEKMVLGHIKAPSYIAAIMPEIEEAISDAISAELDHVEPAATS